MIPNLFRPATHVDTCLGLFAADANGRQSGRDVGDCAKMLVQSPGTGDQLLPALPQDGPAGNVMGLRARGDLRRFAMGDGKLTAAKIRLCRR